MDYYEFLTIYKLLDNIDYTSTSKMDNVKFKGYTNVIYYFLSNIDNEKVSGKILISKNDITISYAYSKSGCLENFHHQLEQNASILEKNNPTPEMIYVSSIIILLENAIYMRYSEKRLINRRLIKTLYEFHE